MSTNAYGVRLGKNAKNYSEIFCTGFSHNLFPIIQYIYSNTKNDTEGRKIQ